MINSKIIHEIQPDFMQEYYKGYTLQIDYDYLKKCYRDIDKIYFRQPDDYINKIILEKILEIIRFYNTDSHDDDIRINSYIKTLVFLLLENLSCKKRNVIETKHKNMIVEILRFIDENDDEYLTVSKISQKFNISEGYLRKLFKENLNMTLKQYINQAGFNHIKSSKSKSA